MSNFWKIIQQVQQHKYNNLMTCLYCVAQSVVVMFMFFEGDLGLFSKQAWWFGFVCFCLIWWWCCVLFAWFGGLKAKVWFVRNLFCCWIYGFGCFAGNLGLSLVLCWRLIMGKKRLERHLINLFCFDVFGYKESTRKTKKIIRKQWLTC